MPKKSIIILLILMIAASACSAKSLWNGNKKRNVVALTFDDGPKAEFCQHILDTLDKHGAKATFFVVGREAEDNPDLIMRMSDMGHEIGNHTYSHILLKDKSRMIALADIQRCSDVIKKITGKVPKYFRPPGGNHTDKIAKDLRNMGLVSVYWTVNAEDYTDITPGYEVPEDFIAMSKELSKKMVDKVKPGSIVLLHNGSEQTVRALPFILEELEKKGYAFVTVRDIEEGKI